VAIFVEATKMGNEPTHGDYLKSKKWVQRITRQRIRDALGLKLPLSLDPPTWTKRPLTPRADCWVGHRIDFDDSEAIEYVSVSESVVRFCGMCAGYWREEAAERRMGR
jgi:hypothetical protein